VLIDVQAGVRLHVLTLWLRTSKSHNSSWLSSFVKVHESHIERPRTPYSEQLILHLTQSMGARTNYEVRF
jgi:hypothetical protein